MTSEQKIIRAKVGLLELAKQLGNVSQACKMMGYAGDREDGIVGAGHRAAGLRSGARCQRAQRQEQLGRHHNQLLSMSARGMVALRLKHAHRLAVENHVHRPPRLRSRRVTQYE
jgi:hypothetical protein